jgi:predicted Fe-Mo cluster-binding NifX family protein
LVELILESVSNYITFLTVKIIIFLTKKEYDIVIFRKNGQNYFQQLFQMLEL